MKKERMKYFLGKGIPSGIWNEPVAQTIFVPLR